MDNTFLAVNLWTDAAIPLVSALIGGTISLWIFKMGFEKRKQEERSKRIQNNYETENYFLINIKSILFFIDKQIDEISKTSRRAKNWKVKNLTLAVRSELKMTELRELNYKTLFQIFVIDREGKTIDKAQNFIDIKNCLHNIEDFIDKHKGENLNPHIELSKNTDLWNEGVKNLMQLYNHLVSLRHTKDDKLISLLNYYLVLKQQELIKNGTAQNMHIFFEEIIEPLKREIISEDLKGDARVLNVIENLLHCQKSFEQIAFIRYQRRKNLLLSGRRLLMIKNLLKNSVEEIEKRKKRIE